MWMSNFLSLTKVDMAISVCVNEGYTLYHVAHCSSHDEYCCFAMLIALRDDAKIAFVETDVDHYLAPYVWNMAC